VGEATGTVNALPEAGNALETGVGKLRGRLGFVYLLGIAVGVQLVQGVVVVHTLAPYTRSYWFITYEAGFTRRGLAGELVRLVTGSIASVDTLEVLQWLLTLTLIGGLGWLVVEAARRNAPALDLAAIALCVSPFVFDFVVAQRRPDQLGFVVVVAYGLVVVPVPAIVGGGCRTCRFGTRGECRRRRLGVSPVHAVARR
jgi:hypothetical protein